MARITMQDSIVTARKFVQIGSDPVSARKKLASALASYQEASTRFNIKEVEEYLKDDSLSPAEKVALKSRWDTMEAAYLRLMNTLETEGLKDMNGVDAMQIAYSTLAGMLQNVFADMTTTSPAPSGLQEAIEAFNIKFNIVSQSYSALAYRIQSYQLRLETSDYYLGYGETATITAKLYKGGVEYTGEKESTIFSTLTWSSSGLKNDINTYIDGRSLKVPYSDFETTFYVNARVSLPIEIL